MKRIIIAQSEKPCRQWHMWLDALVETDWEINIADARSMELQAVQISPDAIVLFDGMLPNLSRAIQRTSIHSPYTQIVVATTVPSFVIRYEVMHLSGVVYLAGPLTEYQFMDAIHKIAFQDHYSAA